VETCERSSFRRIHASIPVLMVHHQSEGRAFRMSARPGGATRL